MAPEGVPLSQFYFLPFALERKKIACLPENRETGDLRLMDYSPWASMAAEIFSKAAMSLPAIRS
jgi:hypothetical protein